ncbi:Uncharacterised protein [Vibrio cholerae]|nr:Uncharacterised protein [Vibrio cholerae]CSB33542.1 Uncharacterised protein [Vibrio cholerae]
MQLIKRERLFTLFSHRALLPSRILPLITTMIISHRSKRRVLLSIKTPRIRFMRQTFSMWAFQLKFVLRAFRQAGDKNSPNTVIETLHRMATTIPMVKRANQTARRRVRGIHQKTYARDHFSITL